MSFLSTNNSEFISARVTQKGRNAIANGNFNIKYFQVGDSEFDYNLIFSGMTGNTNHQMVMSPFDRNSAIKYPYKIDSSTSGTTYGIPINNNLAPESIRNVMGPAGFVTNYIEFDDMNCLGTTIKCYNEPIAYASISGGTLLSVISGSSFNKSEYLTLILSELYCSEPVISGNYTGQVYKIIGITGNTIEVDRELPNVSIVPNTWGYVISNKCDLEYNTDLTGTTCPPILTTDQQNPWTLDVVWDKKPIGVNNSGSINSLSGYTSNKHISTKEFLGYTSTGQTFNNLTGGTIEHPTYYLNSFGDIIDVTPEEQRTIAIIHYSELGDLLYDPERFFKYDDYISTRTGKTGSDESLVDDLDGTPLSDTEYFEVYIPFIQYHRSPTTTFGARFFMDTINYYIKSTISDRHELLFRYLLDEIGNPVGKVFPNNKIVVFDDQELVAILDIRSNRRFTMAAPKLSLINSDTTPSNSLLTGSEGQTLWVTYMFSETGGTSSFNSLPCNCYSKINENTNPSNVTVKFDGDVFKYMGTYYTDIANSFLAKQFYILAQFTNGSLPDSDKWTIMDYSDQITIGPGGYIDSSSMTGVTFTITRNRFDNGTFPFDLEYFMGSGYTSVSGVTQFGEEQPFPGSIRLVRASDIESLNFLVNLPSTQFMTTQNPTYPETGNVDKRITEVALLDENKEALVMGKCPLPIKRVGTQVFSLKLDF